mmetsp:Transcript_1651/g.4093  ORF Transcript_1651/g.4093 Transcript_1651/m.4093 type:complete len:297 (-) Transcript_1651:792-1682(-)
MIALPPYFGIFGCASSTLLYVGLLYLHRGLPRNDPSTIKKRMGSVTLACCLSWIPLALALKSTPDGPSLTQLLGLCTPAPFLAVAFPLALTAVLFACPLALRLQQEGTSMLLPLANRSWITDMLTSVAACDVGRLVETLKAPFAEEHLWLWRNLFVAPLCEEWVFRACMAPLLRLQGYSELATVFITPLFFSVAHLHHLHDLITYQGFPLAQALLTVLFQSLYTAIFGWYATWLFLRSQSVTSVFVVHAFCNWMGLPNFPLMAKLWGLPAFLISLAVSVATFALLLGPATSPSLLS